MFSTSLKQSHWEVRSISKPSRNGVRLLASSCYWKNKISRDCSPSGLQACRKYRRSKTWEKWPSLFWLQGCLFLQLRISRRLHATGCPISPPSQEEEILMLDPPIVGFSLFPNTDKNKKIESRCFFNIFLTLNDDESIDKTWHLQQLQYFQLQ